MDFYSALGQNENDQCDYDISTFLYQDQDDQSSLIEIPDYLISMSKKYLENYDQHENSAILGDTNKNDTKCDNLQNIFNNSSNSQDNQSFGLNQTNYSLSKLDSMVLLSKRSIKENDQESISKLDEKPQDEASMFRKSFYSIFSNKKRLRKEYVKKIHDIIRSKFCFRAMTRDEYRSIDRYFEHYAFYKDSILSFLESNYNRIISKYPELRQYKCRI